MATDYNKIAQQYVESKKDAWRILIEEYTFLRAIGDVRGLKVIDLACGSGHYTRMIKARGAAEVVGVDLSEAMIKLAREEEACEPLGICYEAADATAPGSQQGYDLAVAAYLLPYARDIAMLDSFCRGIARQVRPGGRFVTVTANNNVYDYPRDCYAGCGFFINWEGEARIGATISWNTPLENGEVCSIETYYIPHEEYQAALERAGFRDVRIRGQELDESRLGEFPQTYWDVLMRYPVCLIIEATRA